MKNKTDKFLKTLIKNLREEHWGDIEPEWFDPNFVIVEDEDEGLNEEQEWSMNLQSLVEKSLIEAGLIK